MQEKRIYLEAEGEAPYIDCYLRCDGTSPTMLVIPGGGYGMVCSDREGGPIAEAFFEKGYSAFVLTYRVAPNHRYPTQLLDAARAIAYIRENAGALSVDPNRIFTVGFSAGGHLVGTVATSHAYAEKLLGLPENFARPTGSVYAYPVVSAMCPTHVGSFENLSGVPFCELTDEQKRLFSIEENVTEKTPPAFIWHTAVDELVPVYGSIRLAEAYIKCGVPVSLHIYPYGTHGVALANAKTECGNENWIQPLAEGWVDYAAEFLKTV